MSASARARAAVADAAATKTNRRGRLLAAAAAATTRGEAKRVICWRSIAHFPIASRFVAAGGGGVVINENKRGHKRARARTKCRTLRDDAKHF